MFKSCWLKHDLVQGRCERCGKVCPPEAQQGAVAYSLGAIFLSHAPASKARDCRPGDA